jgi:hypothetical protein
LLLLLLLLTILFIVVKVVGFQAVQHCLTQIYVVNTIIYVLVCVVFFFFFNNKKNGDVASGSCDGRVRLWRVERRKRKLVPALRADTTTTTTDNNNTNKHNKNNGSTNVDTTSASTNTPQMPTNVAAAYANSSFAANGFVNGIQLLLLVFSSFCHYFFSSSLLTRHNTSIRLEFCARWLVLGVCVGAGAAHGSLVDAQRQERRAANAFDIARRRRRRLTLVPWCSPHNTHTQVATDVSNKQLLFDQINHKIQVWAPLPSSCRHRQRGRSAPRNFLIQFIGELIRSILLSRTISHRRVVVFLHFR